MNANLLSLRDRLDKRLKEINERIAEIGQWGAVLTALNEERKGVESAIASLTQALNAESTGQLDRGKEERLPSPSFRKGL